MKYRKKRQIKQTARPYIIGICVLIAVLIFSFFSILWISTEPKRVAKQESLKIAKKYADLERVTSFSIYNGDKTYYSLIGKTSKNKDVAVLITKTSNKVFSYSLSDGASQKEAEQVAKENGATAIDKVVFGYWNDQPIWEIKSGNAYYIVSFKDKTLLNKEGL